jgi:hypothetical protein
MPTNSDCGATAPEGHDSAGKTFAFVEVTGLAAEGSAGLVWWDDGDDDPTTATYLAPYGPGYVVVTAEPYPEISEAFLPDCWTFTGGLPIGSGKVQRYVDTCNLGATTLTATSGVSQRKVTIIVYKAEVSILADEGNRTITDVGHAWWKVELSADANALLPASMQYYIDEGGYWPQFLYSPENIIGPGIYIFGPQNYSGNSHPVTGSYKDMITFDTLLDLLSDLASRHAQPGTYNLYSHNCTTVAVEIGDTYLGLSLDGLVTTWDLSDVLRQTFPPLRLPCIP